MTEYKYVTRKHLQPGQKIHGHRAGNLTSSYIATVKAVSSAGVIILEWGKYEKTIDASSMFRIALTNAEFKAMYKDKAREVLRNISNTLHGDEIGYHEMWNSWLFGTPYEIAQSCVHDNFKVIGYSTDIVTKYSYIGASLITYDIGVCGEYEDGDRFWCHYRYETLMAMLAKYRDLLSEGGETI